MKAEDIIKDKDLLNKVIRLAKRRNLLKMDCLTFQNLWKEKIPEILLTIHIDKSEIFIRFSFFYFNPKMGDIRTNLLVKRNKDLLEQVKNNVNIIEELLEVEKRKELKKRILAL